MELTLDLHVHSIHSPDSYNSIEIIKSRIKEIQFHGYAIADHDTMAGIDEALKSSGELVVVPAMEVSVKGAHILVLDPSEEITEGLSIPEVVDLVHDQGATAILAHPYGIPRSWPRMQEIKNAKLDAIEVANSAQIPYDYICGLNQKLADKLGLPVTGGSDSHVPATIGRSYTIVDSESTDYNDVIKAIKLGRTQVGGSNINFGEWLEKNLFRRLGLG